MSTYFCLFLHFLFIIQLQFASTFGVGSSASGFTACGTHEYRCSAEQCIRASFLCDGDADCDNGADEDPDKCNEPLQVRLVDGPHNASGRVEVKFRGIWGTVCDDSWDENDATVVCRMLGLLASGVPIKDHVTAFEGGHFPAGEGLIWLDNVMCDGTERSVEDCPKRPWARSNCVHHEDAGVTCLGDRITGNTLTNVAAVRPSVKASWTCGRRFPERNVTNLGRLESAKVIGGKPSLPGGHPWQVGIRIKKRRGSSHHCGGTIIAEFYVLSAAHCFEVLPKRMYVVRVGDYSTEDLDAEEEEFMIGAIFIHEQFRQGARMNNDLALLKLRPNKDDQGIQFGRRVQPACLPSAMTLYSVGTKCLISGWGQMEYRDHSFPHQLQESEMPILSWETCSQQDVYGTLRFTDNMFCAGYLDGGIDTCRGDSGGPLVCSSDQDRFILYGVVSWGDGCGMENKPGVYTKVQNYIDWIQEKMTPRSL